MQKLAQAIREAVDAELNELATNLSAAAAHLFSENEFKNRGMVQKIAPKFSRAKPRDSDSCPCNPPLSNDPMPSARTMLRSPIGIYSLPVAF